jgi:hypothetical protein
MVWPEPARITGWEALRLMAGGFIFVIAAGYLGLLVFQRGRLSAILAYVAGVLLGVLWARAGTDWRFRNERSRAKERQFHGVPRQRRPPPVGGFAEQVGRIFRACFRRYVPPGVDRQT